MTNLRNFKQFILDTVGLMLRGSRMYYIWVGFLLLLITSGVVAYMGQVNNGLLVTNMRDQVSWGFYIGNFTFLVGVAAASIMLVIPAYIYDWGPIKEITILGEMLAVTALIMCAWASSWWISAARTASGTSCPWWAASTGPSPCWPGTSSC